MATVIVTPVAPVWASWLMESRFLTVTAPSSARLALPPVSPAFRPVPLTLALPFLMVTVNDAGVGR